MADSTSLVRCTTIAVASSLVGFVLSLITGVAYVVVAALRRPDAERTLGLDLPTFVKHISLPVAAVSFLVAFFIVYKHR
jgi:uncharacterized membrane protein